VQLRFNRGIFVTRSNRSLTELKIRRKTLRDPRKPLSRHQSWASADRERSYIDRSRSGSWVPRHRSIHPSRRHAFARRLWIMLARKVWLLSCT